MKIEIGPNAATVIISIALILGALSGLSSWLFFLLLAAAYLLILGV